RRHTRSKRDWSSDVCSSDLDIEQYRAFLGHLGKLGIPVANYDFHPGNTYTTAQVERRGYVAREFNLDDFRKRVEKQRFEREYSRSEERRVGKEGRCARAKDQ